MHIVSELKIRRVYPKTDNKDFSQTKSKHFDFFIDGTSLSTLLNIDRFDLSFSDFDLDIPFIDQSKFPDYNPKERIEFINQKVLEFTGKKKPQNQLNTNSIVLYRCHCGCDYCGIISFELSINEKEVIWRNIGYEMDKEPDNNDAIIEERKLEIEQGIQRIEMLAFDRSLYELEFGDFFNRINNN